jgi:hypothetical protein
VLTGDAPDGITEQVTALIESLGFTVTTGDCGPANGITSWLTHKVTIRADLEPAARLKTLLHETGHVLAHDPELDLEPSCRGIKEVEAESIAFIVAHTIGLDTSAYSFPYVAHWASGVGDLDAVKATTERVIKHARTILDHLEP